MVSDAQMNTKLAVNDTTLLYKIAKGYYEDGLTKDQIGTCFGLSRIKVSRLLQQARQSRVVQIAIEPLTGSFIEC